MKQGRGFPPRPTRRTAPGTRPRTDEPLHPSLEAFAEGLGRLVANVMARNIREAKGLGPATIKTLGGFYSGGQDPGDKGNGGAFETDSSPVHPGGEEA